MEGMLMLLVMMIITMVLTWVLNGEQRKRAVSLLLCAAMMSSYIPAINVAKADAAEKPVLVNEQVLVNGVKSAQIGAVTYSVSGSAYTLDTSSAKVRVKEGDSISFEGTISAPEGETISWVRVDVYDASTEEPYTVGAEYYRASGMKVQEFDLSGIPALTIGESFGSKDYTLAEGGKYIVMFCVGDSNGNSFADMDADIEDEQGPAILVDVKLSPSNCDHPHSDYHYVLDPSGEIRYKSYGDPLTHQVEPLYERYCGLCDTFLMNIWGQGTPEEHAFDDNGVCLACGYYIVPMVLSNTCDHSGQNFAEERDEEKEITCEYYSAYEHWIIEPYKKYCLDCGEFIESISKESLEEHNFVDKKCICGAEDVSVGNLTISTNINERWLEPCAVCIDYSAGSDNGFYLVEHGCAIRKAGSSDSYRTDYSTNSYPNLKIMDMSGYSIFEDLEPETEYEYFVRFELLNGSEITTPIQTFTTPAEEPVEAKELTGSLTINPTEANKSDLVDGSIYVEAQLTLGEGETYEDYPNVGFLVNSVMSTHEVNLTLQPDGSFSTIISNITEGSFWWIHAFAGNEATDKWIPAPVLEIDMFSEDVEETITLGADCDSEIMANTTVTFTAESNSDEVTLFIETLDENEQWVAAVEKPMEKTEDGEFTAQNQFLGGGKKRAFAKTKNGTQSNIVEITVLEAAVKLNAPVYMGPEAAVVGESVALSWGKVENADRYTAYLSLGTEEGNRIDLTDKIEGEQINYTFDEAGTYCLMIYACGAEGSRYGTSDPCAVNIVVSAKEETITLGADKTKINSGESVTFTAESNAESVTLYIEALNEETNVWYEAVKAEMDKDGSEFTYTHTFGKGYKRAYAVTANGTKSDYTDVIEVVELPDKLDSPVGGTMTATVGEEVTISWGAATNATGYTAHLFKMVDGQLEFISDLTGLVDGTSLKYTFEEADEYHVGIIATATGYEQSDMVPVIVTVVEGTVDLTSPWLENPMLVNDRVSINGMIKLAGKAFDDTELKGLHLDIDGINTESFVHKYEPIGGKEYDLSDWKIYVSEDGWDEGYYSVKLDVEDSDGNFLVDGPVLLGYLTIAGEESSPVIEPIVCTHESPIDAGTEVNFSTTAADDVKLAKIELFIDDVSVKTETVSGLSGTISYTTSSLAIGQHIVKVVATDASGLTNNVSLTVTVQKADSAVCPHKNTTVRRTQEYVFVDAQQHKLVYTDWTHCLDCDTGVSNVQDEDLPEKHTWKDGACEKCEHACSHNYVADENKPIQNSGIWKKVDSEYHIRDQVKYWETCTYCGGEKEGELKQDASAIKEKHNMTNVDIVAYNYNNKTHQALYNVTCSANGCGHKLTSQLGEHEAHQIKNGKCQVCDYMEPIVDDEDNNEDNEYVNSGIYSKPEVEEETIPDYIIDTSEIISDYKESINNIDPSFKDDYQLAKQVLNEEYNTDATLDALVGLTDPFELYLVLTGSDWVERQMLEDMLCQIIGNINSKGYAWESTIEEANGYLDVVKDWKNKLGIVEDFMDENVIYTLVTEESVEDITLIPVPYAFEKIVGEASGLLGDIKDISEDVMDFALFHLKAELAHFEVLEQSLKGTNDELLESVITEMKFRYTNKFLGGVWQAAKDGIETVGSETLDKLLDFVGGKMGGIYSMAYKEVLNASGIVDTVEGSRELIISDMYYSMINGEFKMMINKYQSDPDLLKMEDISKLSAIYDLLNSALIVRNESAIKLLGDSEVIPDTLVLEQLKEEIEQLKGLTLLNWKKNEYYDEDFFEEPKIQTDKYYFEALLNVDYETGNYGYTSRWNEMSTNEKKAVRQSIEELEEYESGCGNEFVMHLVTDVNGAAHLILENEEGMGLLITCDQTEICDGSDNNIVVSTMTEYEVDNYAKNGRIDPSGITNTGHLIDVSDGLLGNKYGNKVHTYITLPIDEAEFERIMRTLVDNNYHAVEDGLNGYPFEMSRELIVSLLYDTYTADLSALEKIGEDRYEQVITGIGKKRLEQIEGK